MEKLKRGGYTGTRKKVVKFRATTQEYAKLRLIADNKNWTLARLIRDFLKNAVDGEATDQK